MNAKNIIKTSTRIYIGASIFALGFVALQSLFNPQLTMDLVSTTLPNTDAMSSIRGIYGGAGLAIVSLLMYLLFRDLSKGLMFLAIFWGAYAISRLLTIWLDGPLGAFGSKWLVIESILCFIAIALSVLSIKVGKK